MPPVIDAQPSLVGPGVAQTLSEPSTPDGGKRRKKSGSARRKKQKSSSAASSEAAPDAAMAPSSLAAYETYKLLPTVSHPYSADDLTLLLEILRTAEREWKAAQPRPRRGAPPPPRPR